MFMSNTNPCRVLLLIMTLMVVMLIATINSNWTNAGVNYNYIFFLLVVFFTIALIFSHNRKIGRLILLLLILIDLCYEIVLSIFQIMEIAVSGNFLQPFTGSYHNMGPYGGFLSICISVLCAYLIKYKPEDELYKNTKYGRTIVFVILGVAITILPATQSRAALLALIISMFFLCLSSQNIFVRIKAFISRYLLISVLFVVVFVLAAYLFKKPSADGRFFMNRISVLAICGNGLKGTGINHFGGSYGDAQADYFHNLIIENGENDLDWNVINEHSRLIADCPDSPYNEYLFVGIEYGPIIMVLFFGVIEASILFSFKRNSIWCFGMISLAVFSFFSYPMHVKQFQILFTILIAACLTDSGCCKDDKKGLLMMSKVDIFIMTLLFLSFTIICMIKKPELKHQKEAVASWRQVEKWYNLDYYDYVVEDCQTLLPYLKHDESFLFDYGQSLSKTGNYALSDSVLKIGTKISCDPMFWNVMGNNSLSLGKYREAEERYKHAFYLVPNRIYPLYLLAKLYIEEGDTASFLKMTEIVETFIPKVESATTEQIKQEIRELKNDYLFEDDN